MKNFIFKGPEEIFQRVNMAKLMVVLMRGETHLYKGKKLEDITVNVNDFGDSNGESKDEDERSEDNENIQDNNRKINKRKCNEDNEEDQDDVETPKHDENDETAPRKRNKRNTWTKEEKKLV